MTQLTYTIAHIKVGAEKYWKELSGKEGEEDIYISPQLDKILYVANYTFDIERNDNHPLSGLANKLGATIYGGFKDEKDFYFITPTVGELKVGDCIITQRKNKGFIAFSQFGFTETTIYNISNFTRPLTINYSMGNAIKGNIFQEYARTGVIENDLYKQFFK